MNKRTSFSGRLFLYGFLVWLIPFIAAFPLFQPLANHRIVFKSLMAVILVTTVAWLGSTYFKKEGGKPTFWAISAVWIMMSVLPDLGVFLLGFKMEPITYFSEIATTYLVIPAILWSQSRMTGKK